MHCKRWVIENQFTVVRKDMVGSVVGMLGSGTRDDNRFCFPHFIHAMHDIFNCVVLR